MGRPTPGWDVAILDEDERPVPPGERGEICLRARSNPHYPLGYWNNEEAARETFGGEWFHTKDAAHMDDGRVCLVRRPRRRRDHRRGLPDRPVRGGIRLPRARGGRRGRRGGITGRACAEAWSRHSSSWRRATRRPTRSPRSIQAHVRNRLSAYHYPRRVEFVSSLPKTLTGKIRRIELREAEARRVAASSGACVDGRQCAL